LVALLLHTIDVGVSWADGVSSAEPVGVGGAGAVLPDKGLVHRDVIQSDPGVGAHEAGHKIVLSGVGDGGEVSAERSTRGDSIVKGSGV